PCVAALGPVVCVRGPPRPSAEAQPRSALIRSREGEATPPPSEAGFSAEQQAFLEGLFSGAKVAAEGRPPSVASASGPDAAMLSAQARAESAGGRLVPEEAAKRDRHPLDRWDQIAERAAYSQFPKGLDVFFTRYQGLFYVAPAQES